MPTVLITGASTGIGRATALSLATAGWTVFAGVRDAGAGERLVADFATGPTAGEGHPSARGQMVPLTLDVTDPAQIAAAAERVREQTSSAGSSSFAGSSASAGPAPSAGSSASAGSSSSSSSSSSGPSVSAGSSPSTGPSLSAGAQAGGAGSAGRLDALVNNAGIGVGGPLELVSPEDLRAQFEVNVFGQLAVTRALLPALRAARGRIVLVSSVGGRVALPFSAPYAASKHALEAIGDALRGELHNSHIHVSLIEPGSVQTPIWAKSRSDAQQLQIPPELESEYGHVPAAFDKVLHDTERRGVAPERVAATIERALTARRPRARYLVGRDARGMVLAHALLPTRVFDRVVRRALGA